MFSDNMESNYFRLFNVEDLEIKDNLSLFWSHAKESVEMPLLCPCPPPPPREMPQTPQGKDKKVNFLF